MRAAAVVAVRLGIAHCVLAGKQAGLAEQPLERPADRAGERPHEPARAEGHPDEEEHDAPGHGR